MPINRKKMAALKKKYGSERGERIYYAMEQKEKSKRKRGKHKARRRGGAKKGKKR